MNFLNKTSHQEFFPVFILNSKYKSKIVTEGSLLKKEMSFYYCVINIKFNSIHQEYELDNRGFAEK
ncbi:hypothetical protein BpHYR1_028649 [Brachionus plicatilis]|uniref:Uncharacterized protein n=1 Tax=Brachionus plicatilis TaxID=10195 RepID=A0A3M7RDL1_BRAPC|nr:hypothetical protein BpHYR1_028649 [Brachionus plicatilis]